MQAFFDADVIDVELLYDNAMLSWKIINWLQNIRKSLHSGWNKYND